jgi:hypothetical protein
MRRFGLHRDGYDFLDMAAFKHQSGGHASSRSSRRICKALARADKARERNTARILPRCDCLAYLFLDGDHQ